MTVPDRFNAEGVVGMLVFDLSIANESSALEPPRAGRETDTGLEVELKLAAESLLTNTLE